MLDTSTVAPLASATTNTRSGSLADALTRIEDELFFLDPLNDQVCVVPREQSMAFLQEANQMQSMVQKLAVARDALLAQEVRWAEVDGTRFAPIELVNSTKEALRKAQADYDAAYAEVKKELGDKGYLASGGDGKELLELVPLARRGPGGKPKEWGRKWTYVRSDKIKSHIRSYKLSGADSANGQAKSFLKQGRIDTQELRKQFTKLDPKLKAEWVLGHDAAYLMPKVQAWAEQLNVKADETKPVQFSAAVHLFRYFAGCGAALEWAPRSGKVAGKLNGKAELNLAYGECKAEGFLPSAPGWALMMKGPKSGNEFHIGVVRLAASAKLTGGAGASVAAELSLEVDYSQLTTLGVKGARRARNSVPAGHKAKLTDLAAGANAGADLFAGARVGGELKGAVQFQNPEKGDKFEDLAAIGPKFDLLMGVGAAGALMLDFDGVKFRFKVKAGVCLGPGAKGEIGLEVDAKRLASFLQWFFHALLNAGFEFLEIVTDEGFKAIKRLQVLLVQGVTDAYDAIDERWDALQRGLEVEERRVALMERVLTNPLALKYCTPEAHGILLWHLSRHGALTKSTHLAANSENWEVLGRRKRAIIQICRWAQCKSQFENMVQHMGPDGALGDFAANYAHLLRFMEIGPGDSAFDDDLRRIYTRLPIEPARGYAVAQNHTGTFLAQSMIGNSPIYIARAQGLLPGNPTATA